MRLPYKYKNLNVNIDYLRIANELANLGESAWTRHGFHNTGHDVVSILSSNGTILNKNGTVNNSLVPPFLPTPYLDKMPYTKEVIYSFGVAPNRTRFAMMRAGTVITPHRDLQPNWYNKVRVHIPICTNVDVKFHIWEENSLLLPQDRADVHFGLGSAWVFDIWRVHAVTNFSNIDRIHLIIDLEPKGHLFDLMFHDVEPNAIYETFSYVYPNQYETDIDTLVWLTAGDVEIGKKLWNAKITTNNPQIGAYKYNEAFWA